MMLPLLYVTQIRMLQAWLEVWLPRQRFRAEVVKGGMAREGVT